MFILYISMGKVSGGTAPILAEGIETYSNPLPHVLILTAIVVATGALLIFGTLDMPSYGDPAAPIHRHVAPRYIADAERETSVPNVVTAVLASYRGFDTMGELAVIFTAGIGVILLLGLPRKRREDDGDGDGESG